MAKPDPSRLPVLSLPMLAFPGQFSYGFVLAES
jgi:hypothetical protein